MLIWHGLPRRQQQAGRCRARAGRFFGGARQSRRRAGRRYAELVLRRHDRRRQADRLRHRQPPRADLERNPADAMARRPISCSARPAWTAATKMAARAVDAGGMRWPHAAAIALGRLVVADAGDNRLMAVARHAAAEWRAVRFRPRPGRRRRRRPQPRRLLAGCGEPQHALWLRRAPVWASPWPTPPIRACSALRQPTCAWARRRDRLAGQRDFAAKGDNRWRRRRATACAGLMASPSRASRGDRRFRQQPRRCCGGSRHDGPQPSAGAVAATEIRVRGRVQGVGFRPTVWRLARELGLAGEVLNDGEGVLIARRRRRRRDARRLIVAPARDSPPLARIDAIEVRPPSRALCRTLRPDEFPHRAERGGATRTEVAPDAAICPDCLRRKSAIPSRAASAIPSPICTHCGPRLAIVSDGALRSRPHDDGAVSTCARRAAPNMTIPPTAASTPRRSPATPAARTRTGAARRRRGGLRGLRMLDDVDAVVGLMLKGEIVAIKGLGGYHLACDATNAERRGATARAQEARRQAVRADGARPRRHPALRAVDAARSGRCWAAPRRRSCCSTRGRKRAARGGRAGPSTLGFMLPTTPLHHLIFRRLDRPVVMTSGNLSDEPQVTDDADARATARRHRRLRADA